MAQTFRNINRMNWGVDIDPRTLRPYGELAGIDESLLPPPPLAGITMPKLSDQELQDMQTFGGAIVRRYDPDHGFKVSYVPARDMYIVADIKRCLCCGGLESDIDH